MLILSTNYVRRGIGDFGVQSRESSFRPGGFLYILQYRRKGARKWSWSGIIIGRFGRKDALVHSRGPYLEVDIEDMRPENRFPTDTWAIWGFTIACGK